MGVDFIRFKLIFVYEFMSQSLNRKGRKGRKGAAKNFTAEDAELAGQSAAKCRRMVPAR
jgi:hypothetical protein